MRERRSVSRILRSPDGSYTTGEDRRRVGVTYVEGRDDWRRGPRALRGEIADLLSISSCPLSDRAVPEFG